MINISLTEVMVVVVIISMFRGVDLVQSFQACLSMACGLAMACPWCGSRGKVLVGTRGQCGAREAF